MTLRTVIEINGYDFHLLYEHDELCIGWDSQRDPYTIVLPKSAIRPLIERLEQLEQQINPPTDDDVVMALGILEPKAHEAVKRMLSTPLHNKWSDS